MSIHDLLEDTLSRWNSVDTEDQVTEALGFWCCYPQFHEQARLRKDRPNVENTLNHVHVLAVNRLMKLAEKMSLDSGAISTCGAICRESFSSGRRKSFSGALRNYWPECIGEFIYEFPEHEQKAIRTASEIIGRMNARFGIERDVKPEPTNECERNILDALREYGSLKGESLSQKAGYEYNGHIKGTLSSMIKRGMIENTRGRGYHLPESQDQGRD